jgi:cytochrome c oxidase assembly protein subunit 15
MYSKSFVRYNVLTLFFIYLVVIAGSFVRISGAGMGCPDWPKCFGQWVPPTQTSELPGNYKEIYLKKREKKISKFCSFLASIGLKKTASKVLSDPTLLKEEPFNARKTWIEYLNRLVGFIAGNLMLVGFFWIALKYRKERILLISAINLILMGIEAWFGSIVVASNLVPWTITVHMFLALVIIALQLFSIHLILPTQNVSHQFSKSTKWLIYSVFAICVYQLFLGTQVREYIDELTKAGFGRDRWTDKLGFSFFVHRSFSWLVLLLMAIMVWRNEHEEKLRLIRVLLAYADMPGLVQTSHLVFATVLFGMLMLLVFRMGSKKS